MRSVVGRKAKLEHGHVSRDDLVAPLTPGASTNKSGRVARVKLVEQRSKHLNWLSYLISGAQDPG